jgi:hypothetical protein
MAAQSDTIFRRHDSIEVWVRLSWMVLLAAQPGIYGHRLDGAALCPVALASSRCRLWKQG